MISSSRPHESYKQASLKVIGTSKAKNTTSDQQQAGSRGEIKEDEYYLFRLF
jgi:hypothetical protein